MRSLVLCVVAVTGLALVFACGDDENPAGPGGSTSSSSSSSGDGDGGASSSSSSSGSTSSGSTSSSSGSTSSSTSSAGGPIDGGPIVPPVATCAAAGGSATVSVPTILKKLSDDGDEAWMSSPAIADLNGDGVPEIIAARGKRVYAWHADGTRVFTYNTNKDRIWASPIVANLTGDGKLEVALAARDTVFMIDAAGAPTAGFPKAAPASPEDRTIAAGDVDGDGALDLVVGARNGNDIVNAFHANGTAVAGFPPVASGVAGCTPGPCYFAGLYDQNLAIGDLDKDGKQDLVMPHDNAYASFFKGTGAVFDSNPMFTGRPKTSGVRYLHDLAEAKQGYANNEQTANQAHFTNTPPAIADINKDGTYEIIMVGSVQNANQTDRLRGTDLWVLHSDASRQTGWEAPFHATGYAVGLADGFGHLLDDPPIANAEQLVGLTNQVTIADIDATKAGLEMIFAGFDGKIHAVAADKSELWVTPYATDGRALTAGIVVADLSADGVPEIIFTTYSPDATGGNLFVLSSAGNLLHKVPLPTRGSMAAPTIGDANGNGTLDIVVPIKGLFNGTAKDNTIIFEVPGSKPNCMLWATGRGNYLRNGWVP